MTQTVGPSMVGEPASYDIVRVGAGPVDGLAGRNPFGSAAKLLEAAAARLVATSSTEKGAGKRFLDSARQHSIDLSHFFASVNRVKGNVREVCLAVPGNGGTAMFFASNPGTDSARAELADVVKAACASLRGIRLAQALLDTDEHGSAAALTLAGFRRLDELIYLRRPRPAPAEFVPNLGSLPPTLTVTSWSPGDDDDLRTALDRTYVGTLDCPELCGMRPTSDVLQSHRNTGKWDPACWWVIRDGTEPVGAMLFNPCPEQDSIELVYFGVDPRYRGKGVAGTLLRIGLASLASRKETTVACAVDARNSPARKLYERAGFTEFSRRVALVRPV